MIHPRKSLNGEVAQAALSIYIQQMLTTNYISVNKEVKNRTERRKKNIL